MEKTCCFLFLLITGCFALKLKYLDCNDDKSLLHVDSVNLNPYPVILPGDLTPSGHGVLGHNLTSNIELKVSIHKSALFWIPVPCISGFGSCTYDLCDLLKRTFVINGRTECPPQMAKQGLPCTCPFEAGTYTLSPDVWTIPKPPTLLSWLAAGDYKVDAKLIDKTTNKQVGCYNMEITFKKPPCHGFLCSFG